jgi:hypothetical protein
LIAAHGLNFLIFLGALVCFEFFYRSIINSSLTIPHEDVSRLPEWSLWLLAHAL